MSLSPIRHSREGGNPAQLRKWCISTCKRYRSDLDGYHVYIMASKRNGTRYIGWCTMSDAGT